MNLGEALLNDYAYCQKNDSYILDKNGWFEKAKMNETLAYIQRQVINAYRNQDKSGKILSSGCIYIDMVGLADVLFRYSRDVFGQKRLEFQIESLTKNDLNKRELLIKNLSVFGCRTSSSEPYFYRKIGYLFYWFSMIKPFHLDLTKVDITKIPNPMKFYFNEYTTYALLKKIVDYHKENNKKFQLTIHDDKYQLRYFLYDLHYRDLSRSSLEFFLKQYIVPVENEEERK
ncbi:MAG: hypothetical protein LBI14_00295 [Treponema sp.]|nr:hypothetical protein [Treponema sp.]